MPNRSKIDLKKRGKIKCRLERMQKECGAMVHTAPEEGEMGSRLLNEKDRNVLNENRKHKNEKYVKGVVSANPCFCSHPGTR